MKKRKWTMKRIVDTLFVLVILGDDLHQDSENAGGDHMADTASLKEILFRHSAEQCKVCEAIPFDQIGHQIEYEKFKMLHEVIEEADLEDEYQEWRRAYGYV